MAKGAWKLEPATLSPEVAAAYTVMGPDEGLYQVTGNCPSCEHGTHESVPVNEPGTFGFLPSVDSGGDIAAEQPVPFGMLCDCGVTHSSEHQGCGSYWNAQIIGRTVWP